MNNTCGCTNVAERGQECSVEKAETVQNGVAAECKRTYVPAVDIVNGENETLVVADMPGAGSGDVEIMVEKNILTVKASVAPVEYEGKSLVYSEYGVGNYERSFSLSENVKTDGITAEMKNGILRIHIPKAKPVTTKVPVAAN